MSEAHPKMFYFGPWDEPGHYLFAEGGRSVKRDHLGSFPWSDVGYDIDGKLQPHVASCKRQPYCGCGSSPEGIALLHHKNGWTALSFWDRSVDARGGCNSNYFAEGTFTFPEMVEMAKARFSARWSRMKFEVQLKSE